MWATTIGFTLLLHGALQRHTPQSTLAVAGFVLHIINTIHTTLPSTRRRNLTVAANTLILFSLGFDSPLHILWVAAYIANTLELPIGLLPITLYHLCKMTLTRDFGDILGRALLLM